jgi:hypothetical protein
MAALESVQRGTLVRLDSQRLAEAPVGGSAIPKPCSFKHPKIVDLRALISTNLWRFLRTGSCSFLINRARVSGMRLSSRTGLSRCGGDRCQSPVSAQTRIQNMVGLRFFFFGLRLNSRLRTPDFRLMVVRVCDVLPGSVSASTGLNMAPTHSAPPLLSRSSPWGSRFVDATDTDGVHQFIMIRETSQQGRPIYHARSRWQRSDKLWPQCLSVSMKAAENTAEAFHVSA